MPVETHVDRARTRVRAERGAVAGKLGAFDAFVDRVEALSTDPTPVGPLTGTETAGALVDANPSTTNRCRAVRTAFAETVHPHSVDDTDEPEPLLATVRAELSDEVAVALAPTTEPSFSAELKSVVVSTATARRRDAEVVHRALGREATHLESAGETVDGITAWIADADETPLTDLGFEQLRQRHETLARHRDRCDELVERRQAFLQRSTNGRGGAGTTHRRLVRYLYRDFPVDHPLLATVVRLDATCAGCQRAVRNHLVRRA